MIALYRGSGLLSRVIRWQTRSEYSHAAWVRADGSVIEAWGFYGVRHVATPWSIHREKESVDLWAVDGITRTQTRLVENFLVSQLGQSYDWLSVLRFVSRQPAPDDERWFCSELVAEALRKAGLPLLNAPSYLISPGHIPWSLSVSLVWRNITPAAWRDFFSKPSTLNLS